MGTSQYIRLQRLCDIRAGSRLVGRSTALMLAAWKGHTVVVEQLIAAGAALDVQNNKGYERIYPTATAVRHPSQQPTFLADPRRSPVPRWWVTRSWSSSSSLPAPASISRTTMGTSQYTRLQRLCDIRAGSRLRSQMDCAHLGHSKRSHARGRAAHCRRRRPRSKGE
jgi:hypothetical protein